MNAAVTANDASTPEAPAEAPTQALPALTLRLFGTFTLLVRGQPAPPLSRSARALIALLAIHDSGGRRLLERDFVAATLWPDSDDAAAHYNLRRTLTEVRGALGPEVDRLHAPRGTERTLRLDLTSGDAWCDIDAFDIALAQAQAQSQAQAERGGEETMRAAVELYASGGALLAGERGEWLYHEREARKNQYLSARERLARYSRERGEFGEAIEHLQAVVALDPMRETAVRDLMAALSESGQAASALATYQSLRVRLHKEANAVPDAETTALYKRLYQKARLGAEHHGGTSMGVDSPTREEPVLSASSFSQRYNLPYPLTPLIGREKDCVEVTAYLSADKDQPPVRLLTLLGAGGVGKTRLALAVAKDVAPHYEEGACFVDLAPVSASTRLVSVVADALRLTEPASSSAEDDPFRFLAEALRPRQLLLVLDNCEHVAAEAARLAMALLRACPRLTLLATSREPLHVPGEVVWRVSGLAHDDAARLFLMRATEANARFHPQIAQMEAVQAIVTRLDGIPLAIEMAAARTRALPVNEIAKRLDNAFHLLAVPGGDLLPRHQTLRATLDWSYDLLSAAEQTLLARLSVFAGGWTLAAAEAICAGGDFTENIAKEGVFDLLASLIEKSLVQFHFGNLGSIPEDEARYRMLETVRQYATEKLWESEEKRAIQSKHREWCLLFAEETEKQFQGPDQNVWVNRLESEHDNLRVALTGGEMPTTARLSVLPVPKPESTREAWQASLSRSRLAGMLYRFWLVRGYLSEGRERIDRALADQREIQRAIAVAGPISGSEEEEARDALAEKSAAACALRGAGALANRQNDLAAARAYYEESLRLYREVGDESGIADGLRGLGIVDCSQGNYPSALALHTESIRIKREVGDKRGLVNALNCLGLVHYRQGEYSNARTLYQESLSLSREIGDKTGIANMLNGLGIIDYSQGDYDSAQKLYQECLSLYRELGDKSGTASTLTCLGLIEHSRGGYAAARAFYEESLSVYREIGDKRGIANGLNCLGDIVLQQDDLVLAQRHYEESLSLHTAIGDKRNMGNVLNCLGVTALKRGDRASAWSFYEEGLRLKREIGDRRGVANTLNCLGSLALERNEADVARTLYEEGLRLSREIGDKRGVNDALRGMSEMAFQERDFRKTMTLSGAAYALSGSLGAALSQEPLADRDRYDAEARTVLGDAAFTAAWDRGCAMTWEQAVQFALQE